MDATLRKNLISAIKSLPSYQAHVESMANLAHRLGIRRWQELVCEYLQTMHEQRAKELCWGLTYGTLRHCAEDALRLSEEMTCDEIDRGWMHIRPSLVTKGVR